MTKKYKATNQKSFIETQKEKEVMQQEVTLAKKVIVLINGKNQDQREIQVLKSQLELLGLHIVYYSPVLEDKIMKPLQIERIVYKMSFSNLIE